MGSTWIKMVIRIKLLVGRESIVSNHGSEVSLLPGLTHRHLATNKMNVYKKHISVKINDSSSKKANRSRGVNRTKREKSRNGEQERFLPRSVRRSRCETKASTSDRSHHDTMASKHKRDVL